MRFRGAGWPGARTCVRLLRISALGLFAAMASWLAANWLSPFPREKLDRPHGQVILDRHGEVLRMFLAADGRWRLPADLDEISPGLVAAVVASEDQWFDYHPGVNPASILRAALSNLRSGEVVSGASTIPMQIARLMEPRRRSLSSKLLESFRALQMSRLYSKDELLRLYLNLAPYGGNVEGVRAAAFFYFGKSPSRLSWAEIALLTTLPRSPVSYDPTRHPKVAARARDRVIDQLLEKGIVTAEQARIARSARLPSRRRKAPFRAPHLAELVRRQDPLATRLYTTLDLETQGTLEQRVKSRKAWLRQAGIGNAAVVVLDTKSREVIALAGSAGYGDSMFQGQVNGATAARSPGSTLKPFLYALAYDRGLIVPDSPLLDVPYDYSGYVPENYDQLYRGQVSASQALVQSLNVPAVHLLARTGLESFHELLLAGGLSSLSRPSLEYGLPLVLGGGEVRLLDLTNLYSSLAEGGLHRPFRVLREPARPARRLFSREAAALTMASLTQLRRPDLPQAWDLTGYIPSVAWKTGTSYGHRDAWAIGFSPRLTVGVWVGNFDGSGVKGLSGADHAGPLLFDVFRALEPNGSKFEEPQGLELEKVSVCPISGQRPTDSCPTRLVTSIRGRSTFRACPVHRRIFVDARTGLRLDGPCLTSESYVARVVEVLPPALVAWRRHQGEPVEGLPPRAPSCRQVAASDGPRIVSPDDATPYLLRRGVPRSHQTIALTALAEAGPLYWYQDGLLVASGEVDATLFLEPVPGRHDLVVMDRSGRSDRIVFRVE